MSRILYSAVLVLLSGLPLHAGQINFVYPSEGASLPPVPKTFVFGNISPSTAAFTINGEKIAVHPNGGFLAYLPVAQGDFSFIGALEDGTTAQRALKVRQPADALSPTGALKLEFTSYSSDSENLAGEYLKIMATGTPSHEAVCSLEGVFNDLPMAELPAGSGRYYASYLAKDTDRGEGGALTARFKAGLFARGASAKTRGKVKIIKQPVLVETSTDTVILRNAVDGGYMMFLPKGVKLVSNGRAGGMRRVPLSGDEFGWVDDSKVQLSPGAQFPFAYGSETGAVRLKKTEFGSSATLTLYERLPYTAEAYPWGLRLTLYYANLHTNTVVYDSADTLVKNVSFRQAAYNKVEVDFETEPGALWGYNISYPNSSRALQVDLRARPVASLAWPRPLSGLTVVLDPGHSPKFTTPYDGAIGPMGTLEFQVNMATARVLNEKLSALGALVQMTRTGDETVALADRPRIAKELGGDLFISLHNNAIADGEDPFAQPRGFSVYYYQRYSRQLAAAIHRSYLKNMQLPDEGLRYGDYMVARMTWMPAALVESAYMIFPRHEEMLNTPAFQEELAGAIAEGVLEFFNVPARTGSAKKVQ
ncbi:MAG: N-acetylmuramoyl-L-alanine amidase [Elusimicrobiota bacterium]|nr:N-acetylmuramoyl-L-alanine amidase [Elusimicrobiota bacterium]